jgi:protoporphyrin/coproporphyrin ferrochelatase
MARTGVLLTAFGGPGDLDQVVPFISSIMGSEPSEEAARDARRRYLTIGGASPLPPMAERIAVQLERELSGLPFATESDEDAPLYPGMPVRLERAAPGSVRIPVRAGMLHGEPSIAQAVAALAATGVRTIVTLALSPFEARVTTGAYRDAVAAAVADHQGVSVVEAADYRGSEPFLTALVDSTHAALDAEEVRSLRALLVFSAHSLPVEDMERDPSYVEQLRETAAAVAKRAGFGEPGGFDALPGVDAFGSDGAKPWLLAFQSKGRRGGTWLGPDVEDVIDAAVAAGFEAVVVAPIGFALDHLETLYDLDVCAADRALSADIEFSRAPALNDDTRFLDALVEAVNKVM